MKNSSIRLCLVVLASTVGLTACSGDNFITRGLRGKPPETLTPDGGYGPRLDDQRPLIAQVTALQVDSTPGGAIIRATGLPDGVGYWDADLVPADPESDGANRSELRLEFRVRPPETPAPGGSVRSREVTVATFASTYDLTGINSITVVAAQNSRTTRR